MHYNSFPQFKGGLLEAAPSVPPDVPSPKMMSDAKIDILFQHYNHARGQASLTLGRLDDTTGERETRGTSFEGGKGQLLLTPKASGFSENKPSPTMTWSQSKTVMPGGIMAGEWKDKGGRVIKPPQWKEMSTQQQMDQLMANKWSIWLNDSFILGGIHSHAVFHLISNIPDLQGNAANAQFPFNVTQRELIGLLTFGYSSSTPLAKGSEYKCTQTQLADAATFKSYCEKMVSQENRVRQRAS